MLNISKAVKSMVRLLVDKGHLESDEVRVSLP